MPPNFLSEETAACGRLHHGAPGAKQGMWAFGRRMKGLLGTSPEVIVMRTWNFMVTSLLGIQQGPAVSFRKSLFDSKSHTKNARIEEAPRRVLSMVHDW